VIRLATSNDLDLAPFFFPIEAGWVMPPSGLVETVEGTPGEGVERLLAGQLDIALVGPAIYAANRESLQVLPLPLLTSDIYSDNIFLISHKRLDQYEKPRITLPKTNLTAEGLIRILAKPYYGFEPEFQMVGSELEALNAMSGLDTDMCILSGEVGMRAAGPANTKGYFVEDLSKAWWLLVGLPIPLGLFAIRKSWIKETVDASGQARQMILFLRNCLQKAKEQMPTLTELEERRTGLPAEALIKHFGIQRYEPNAGHLRGWLEFYRRGAMVHFSSPLTEIDFFPALGPVPAPPHGPVRRSQPENKPTPDSKKRARDKAQEQGLTVLRGGKDSKPSEESNE